MRSVMVAEPWMREETARAPSLRLRRVESAEQAARPLAEEIAGLLARPEGATLGLASGRSPLALYRELARKKRAEGLSFARARFFALDEYLGLGPEHPSSFARFLHESLLDALEVDPSQLHLLDGRVDPREAQAHCAAYERAIRAAGGIDLQVLGLGRNGHLAFNEPGSARSSRTRLVRLAEETRRANRASFPPGEEVPERALSMGLATILEARRLRVLAFGAEKAASVRRALHEPVGTDFPATFLREHADVELWLDEAAAAQIEGPRA